jgi:hypothetical protein
MKRGKPSQRETRPSETQPSATKKILFAWVAPAGSAGSPVDHTWVTTYDNRVTPYANIDEVKTAGEFYWYCWGDFHASGGTPDNPTGFLGQQSGDLTLAQCLVEPNADSRTVAAARGTIYTYGIDGVCHQLANQVLYATRAVGVEQLTVCGARGYMASTFLYGETGLQQEAWQNQIARCGSKFDRERPMAAAGSPVPGVSDDFEAHAREVLKQDDPKLLSDLLALRADVQRFSAQRWPGVTAPDAKTLNARNQHMLDQAAKLLGPERFKAIFGFPPEQKIDLVDPNIKQEP